MGLAARPGHHRHDGTSSFRLGDLDPVVVSEVIADLTHLTTTTDGTPR
ncbi:hypothetical protein [Actinomadura sp. CNU-125]|nr:hypothetical protein [Actinomadura sp. CNU-125]